MAKTETKKKKRRRPPRPYRPGVIVCKEKHGTAYYWAVTKKQLHKNALVILRERFDAGYWYVKPEKQHYGNPPELTEEQAQALPDGEIKKAALKQHKRWSREEADYEQAVIDYEFIEAALEHEDGLSAWQALSWRADYEYEGVFLAYPEGEPRLDA